MRSVGTDTMHLYGSIFLVLSALITSVLSMSPVAGIAATFENTTAQSKVYWQDLGGIQECIAYSTAPPWICTINNTILPYNDPSNPPLLKTPLAAVQWNAYKQVRVYFLNQQNNVVQRRWSGGSWVSDTMLNITAAKGSTEMYALYSPPTSATAEIVRVGFLALNGSLMEEYTVGTGGWQSYVYP